MEDLAVELGMSCHLCMLYQSQTMVVVQASSPSPVSLSIAEGSLFSTLNTTSGRVLLANSPDTVRDMILQRENDFAKLNDAQHNDLYAQLTHIRAQDIHQANCSFAVGVTDFSTLIGKPEGKIIAALTVSAMNTTHDSKTKAKQITTEVITERLIETSNKIERQLGY